MDMRILEDDDAAHLDGLTVLVKLGVGAKFEGTHLAIEAAPG